MLLTLLRFFFGAATAEERTLLLLLLPCCRRRRRRRRHLPRKERRAGQDVHQRAYEMGQRHPGAPAAPPGQGRGGERPLRESNDGRPEVSRSVLSVLLSLSSSLQQQPGRDRGVGEIAEVEHEEAPPAPREADGAGRQRGEGEEQEGRGDEVGPRGGGERGDHEEEEAPEEGFITSSGLLELFLKDHLVQQDGMRWRGSESEVGRVEVGGGRGRRGDVERFRHHPIVVASIFPHLVFIFAFQEAAAALHCASLGLKNIKRVQR